MILHLGNFNLGVSRSSGCLIARDMAGKQGESSWEVGERVAAAWIVAARIAVGERRRGSGDDGGRVVGRLGWRREDGGGEEGERE